MNAPSRLTLVAAAASVLPLLSQAQTLVGRSDSVYTWHGALPSRALLTVRNYNGPIDVRPADGSTAEVRAVKRTEDGGSLQDVAFEIQNGSNGDVTVCATYRGHNPCDDHSYNDNDDDRGRHRSVTVAITVLMPRGGEVKVTTGNGEVSLERVGGDVQAATGNGRVRVVETAGTVRVSTGNGDVDVRGAKSAVRVTTGNGRVNVTTAEGPVDARTGNGSIDVTMSRLTAREDMAFHTGSGSVRVTLPPGYNGQVEASTGSGEVRSDFEMKVQGRLSPNHLHAIIGDGGPMLRLTSGSGRLEILKG